MKFRQLGSSGFDTSVIGLGTLHFGVYLDQRECSQLVEYSLDVGLNFIDTSPIYGHGQSESLVGQAIRTHRHKVVLASKAGLSAITHPDGSFGVETVPLTEAYLRASIDNSLSALGTDRIDLLQLHAFDHETPLEDTLGALAALVQEGKIRYVGGSNYNPEELVAMLMATRRSDYNFFVSLQAHYNLVERRAEQELAPICLSNRIGLICNRALGRGVLTGKYRIGEPWPEGSRARSSLRIGRGLDVDLLKLVAVLGVYAEKQGRSMTELALAWLLDHDAVSLALVGARTPQQLRVCIDAANRPLTPDERNGIESIISEQDFQDRAYSRPEVFFEK